MHCHRANFISLDGGIIPWLDTFAERIQRDLRGPNAPPPVSKDAILPPRIEVSVCDEDAKAATPLTDGQTMYAAVTKNERMTSDDHFQDVRCIDLTLVDSDATVPAYRAGDVVCVMPENKPEDVEALLQRLGWADIADKALLLTKNDTCTSLSSNSHKDRPWPPAILHDMQRGALSLRRLLTVHLAPFAVPRRSFFDLIRHFSPPDHREHEKLVEFLQPGEGTDDMYEYAQRVRRTMAEVLAEFKSVKVPIAYAIDLFPLMRERQYSIASNPTVRRASTYRCSGIHVRCSWPLQLCSIKRVCKNRARVLLHHGSRALKRARVCL